MTRSKFWQFTVLIVGILILGIVLTACGGDDNDDSTNNAEDNNSVSDTNPPDPPTSTPEATILSPTLPEGPPATIETSRPTLTPTLPFDSWRVAGEWSINYRYTITNGGPFMEVDEWIYSGQSTIFIEENGTVTGSGVLYPAPIDERCIVTPLDGEGYPFTVNGMLHFDGQNILMDITMNAVDYLQVEEYTVLCPDYLEPREVQNNFIWPALSQIERLSYTFWMDEGGFQINFSEDLGLRTDRVLVGILSGELLLQR